MPGNFVSLFVCFCFPRKHQPEMTYRSNSMIPLSETITCSYHNKHNTVLVLAKDILFITRDATTSLRILDVVRGFLFLERIFQRCRLYLPVVFARLPAKAEEAISPQKKYIFEATTLLVVSENVCVAATLTATETAAETATATANCDSEIATGIPIPISIPIASTLSNELKNCLQALRILGFLVFLNGNSDADSPVVVGPPRFPSSRFPSLIAQRSQMSCVYLLQKKKQGMKPPLSLSLLSLFLSLSASLCLSLPGSGSLPETTSLSCLSFLFWESVSVRSVIII